MRQVFLVLLVLTSLYGSAGKPMVINSAINRKNHRIKNTYVPTGFYFLAKDSEGVKMRERGSNKVYSIAPIAFASVKNIVKTKLGKTTTDKGVYGDFCMTFDPKGTNDLKEGTGNPLHAKIAVVIANQLLYVVDNNAKIKTGVMCVELVGYSDAEMKAMQNKVEHKR